MPEMFKVIEKSGLLEFSDSNVQITKKIEE
jgi:hypothetical protein